MIVYPDTSFLFAQYVADLHSAEADRRMKLAPSVLVTPFHRAELANAIFQQVFRRRLSASEANLAFFDFQQDCDAGVWTIVEFPDFAFKKCIELARRHTATLGFRTLDSLHVAAALELRADRFWTFDDRQKKLAEVEGLATV